jgi:hypothetical protein
VKIATTPTSKNGNYSHQTRLDSLIHSTSRFVSCQHRQPKINKQKPIVIMPEGGILPWKIQKLNVAPSLSYDSIHKPLKAPKGKRWNYDSTENEWSLVSETTASDESVVVDAIVIREDDNDKTSNTNANTTMTLDDTSSSSPFVEHKIESSDTFQGICLKYKITPLELRRANGGFSGQNLQLVPNTLKIPRSNYNIMTTSAEATPINTEKDAVSILRRKCHGMSASEAKAYLMLSDWNLTEAIENAKEDGF